MGRWLTLHMLLMAPGCLDLVASPGAVALSPKLHNVFQVTANIYSGSQPEGEEGFTALEELGIKTILSVDGAIPDVERAKQHGMRYVHLPIGYDGIPPNRVLELAGLAATLNGPLYVHCHHGKHRGPTAAAALCLAEGTWTPMEALAWLHQAGTSTNYLGLYRSIREYQPPSPADIATLTNSLPEISKPSGIVQAMVALDKHREQLKASQDAGWTTPLDKPDLTPAHEALMLREQFSEIQRLPELSTRPPTFQRLLGEAQEATAQLRQELQDLAPDAVSHKPDELLNQVTQSCTTCHTLCRN